MQTLASKSCYGQPLWLNFGFHHGTKIVSGVSTENEKLLYGLLVFPAILKLFSCGLFISWEVILIKQSEANNPPFWCTIVGETENAINTMLPGFVLIIFWWLLGLCEHAWRCWFEETVSHVTRVSRPVNTTDAKNPHFCISCPIEKSPIERVSDKKDLFIWDLFV